MKHISPALGERHNCCPSHRFRMSRLLWGIVLLLCLVCLNPLHAQPDSLWSEIYGTNGARYDDCEGAILLSSGEYLMVGSTWEAPARPYYDILIAKADSAGNEIWTRTYGERFRNNQRNDESGYSVAERHIGGYLVAGLMENEEGDDFQGMVLALSENGDSLWMRGYTGTDLDGIFSLPDGGFVAAGRDRPFFWLFKCDSVGEVEWEHVYDNIGIRASLNAQRTSDGGYILVGISGSSMVALKTDSTGEYEWSQVYRPDTLSTTSCSGVAQTTDGGFILTGYGRGRLEHGYSVRTDEDGEVLWDATYGYRGATWFWSTAQTADGGFVFGGDSYIEDGRELYMVRTDENGEQLWELHYGRNRDRCTQVLLTQDGGYALAGNTGTYQYNRREELLTSPNFWLVKTGPDPVNQEAVSIMNPAFPSRFALHSPYPNPFNSSTSITYDIPVAASVSLLLYDLSGRQLVTMVNCNQQAGVHRIIVNAGDLPSGLYFVRLEAAGQQFTRKIMLIR